MKKLFLALVIFLGFYQWAFAGYTPLYNGTNTGSYNTIDPYTLLPTFFVGGGGNREIYVQGDYSASDIYIRYDGSPDYLQMIQWDPYATDCETYYADFDTTQAGETYINCFHPGENISIPWQAHEIYVYTPDVAYSCASPAPSGSHYNLLVYSPTSVDQAWIYDQNNAISNASCSYSCTTGWTGELCATPVLSTSQMQSTVNGFGSGAITSALSTGSGPVGNIVLVLVGLVSFVLFVAAMLYKIRNFKFKE